MNPAEYIKKGTEYEHQVALFMRAAFELRTWPELKWLHAIQNEEKSGSVIVGTRSKASGKKAGVSDISFPVKRLHYSGLYIELKTLTGKPSKEQLEFGDFVESQGFKFAVCYGWEHSWSVLKQYLELQ